MWVDYGTSPCARIDGVVEQIALEIEARNGKQVRGAVMDLLWHTAPKKLLLLLAEHNNPSTAAQCTKIFGRHLEPRYFRVVVLHRSKDRADAANVNSIRTALVDLGWGADTDTVTSRLQSPER